MFSYTASWYNWIKKYTQPKYCPIRYILLSRRDGNRQIHVGRSILIHTVLLYKCHHHQSAPAISPTSPRHIFLSTALCGLRRDGQYWVFFSISFLPFQLSPNRRKKLSIILYGFDRDNEALFETNIGLQYAAKIFVVNTKRFNHNS